MSAVGPGAMRLYWQEKWDRELKAAEELEWEEAPAMAGLALTMVRSEWADPFLSDAGVDRVDVVRELECALAAAKQRTGL